MTFNEFYASLRRFDDFLKKLPLKENQELSTCRIEASDFGSEIKVIVSRIEVELKSVVKIENIILDLVKENKQEEAMKLVLKWMKPFVKLRLDIKDFFIHTRMFLDILCRIIKICYCKNGQQLPLSMTDLLKNKKSLEIDKSFFEELRKKMSWYNNFVKSRNRIVHYLGQLVFTNTREGKFGFGIRKKINSEVGADTVKSIEEFIEETFKNLTEVLNYLTQNLIYN